MPRLFTGLEIPAAIGRALGLRGGLPGARWVEPENYHITFASSATSTERGARRVLNLE